MTFAPRCEATCTPALPKPPAAPAGPAAHVRAHRHPLADAAPDVRADLGDDAGRIGAEDMRQRRAALVAPASHAQVERPVHRDRADLDEDLARTGGRARDVLH